MIRLTIVPRIVVCRERTEGEAWEMETEMGSGVRRRGGMGADWRRDFLIPVAMPPEFDSKWEKNH